MFTKTGGYGKTFTKVSALIGWAAHRSRQNDKRYAAISSVPFHNQSMGCNASSVDRTDAYAVTSVIGVHPI